MVLIDCYECSEKVSDLAEVCPHCGAPGRSDQLAGSRDDFQLTPVSPSRSGAGAVLGAWVGFASGVILMLQGCGLDTESPAQFIFLLIAVALFSSIGAVIGWAVCK